MELSKFATELTENKEEKVIEISEVMVEDIMPKLKDYIKNIEEETKEDK